MRGQFRVVNELLLFGIGALIALSVAETVSFVVNSLQPQAEKNQYYMLANLVSMATTKMYICGQYGNCSLIVDIPQKLSEDGYLISILNNKIFVSNFRTGEEINISAPNFSDKNMNGYATSSARYFVLDSINKEINLSRRW